MGARGGDNTPGRSRANRPLLRHPRRVRPPDDPVTKNYRGRSLADGTISHKPSAISQADTGTGGARTRAPSEEEGGRGQRSVGAGLAPARAPPAAGEYPGDAVN